MGLFKPTYIMKKLLFSTFLLCFSASATEQNVSDVIIQIATGRGHLLYSDLGARGNGKTDDMEAIVATHQIANQYRLPVKADEGYVYYIGGRDLTAFIRTDTDFGESVFLIDDTSVENRDSYVFLVDSPNQPLKLNGITQLSKGQRKVDLSLPYPCLVTVTNTNRKHYIRYGRNQNNGSPQTDIFILSENGSVDPDTPIVWDFDQITEIVAQPMDQEILTLTGGRFTTIANREEPVYDYFKRGLGIRRSNVIVDGLEHHVTGEGEHGAPYSGFIRVSDCANVTVKNATLTGRKTYETIGAARLPVSMGSYDILLSRALNVSFFHCRQSNDITDNTYWGIMGSNYCKNLVLDNCVFSRFDAHRGVTNATIQNSTLGHMGINAIGNGTFLVEKTTVQSRRFVNLRSDYGSTWQGELVIRDSVFVPSFSSSGNIVLITGANSGQHDFGYTCYMPERILFENFHIDDSHYPSTYTGPAIFANFNPKMTDEIYIENYPYVKTEEVVLRNVTTASGKPLRISDNPLMFRNVTIDSDS